MYIVILSGGSGKRLWPLSNDLYSKQYIKIINQDSAVDGTAQQTKCSMLQRVYQQLKMVNLDQKLVIIANEPQLEIIESQLGKDIEVILEPSRRDTMPAILLACAWLKSVKKIDDEEYIAVMPVDSYTELSFFQQIPQLEIILKESNSQFGLIGASPTYPSEKYGYIMPKTEDIGKYYVNVESFKEKPDLKLAEKLIAQGGVWNCGVVAFSLSTIDSYIKEYNLPFQYNELVQAYDKIPAVSFDYGILEKSKELVALIYNGIWKDLGTWNTLTEEMKEKSIGNVICDKTCYNTNAINVLDIPMVIMGGRNLAVVASHDGILVADKEQSSYLKDCLKELNFKPRFEERGWGIIKTLDIINKSEGKSVVTNRIKVFKEKYTTYHLHKMHDEIITVLSGEGILLLEGKKIILTEGVSYRITANHYHAVKSLETLKYIEVLIGKTDIDDVERWLYHWNQMELLLTEKE